MRGIGLLVALLVLALLLFGAGMLLRWSQDEGESLAVLDTVPDFQFTESHGQPFGRADMMGKLSVVDFIFTRCKGPCPVMADGMERLYQHFKSDTSVQFVSISVDPDYDSLSVLRAYAAARGVTDNRWRFLRAPMDQVTTLCEQGFKLPAEDLPGGHTTRFVLVDDSARIRKYYVGTDSLDIAQLETDIAKLASRRR